MLRDKTTVELVLASLACFTNYFSTKFHQWSSQREVHKYQKKLLKNIKLAISLKEPDKLIRLYPSIFDDCNSVADNTGHRF